MEDFADLHCDEDPDFLFDEEISTPENATRPPRHIYEADFNSDEDFSYLFCDENPDFLFSGENTSLSRNAATISENEDDYVRILVQRETSHTIATASSSSPSSSAAERLKTLRSDAIRWIQNTIELSKFHFETTFLGIAYFDRFLSKKPFESGHAWEFQLLAVACVVLAAKMEENKVPSLLEFCKRDYAFEKKEIRAMELSVLKTLEWRLASITPFAYINYFFMKLSDDGSRIDSFVPEIARRALAFLTEMSLMSERPSTIAAAAVLATLDKGLTWNSLELKMNKLSSCGHLQNDNVFACYRRMLELGKARANRTNMDTSPGSSSNPSSSTVTS